MREIKKEDQDFLVKLSKEMVSQDKVSTSYVYFVVMAQVKNYTSYDGNWSEKEKKEDIEDEDICETCSKKYEEDGEYIDDCDDCGSEAFHYFEYKDTIMQDAGIFLTSKACKEYIERRSYEYYKPVCYGLSNYHSNEMRRLMEIIIRLTSNKELLK